MNFYCDEKVNFIKLRTLGVNTIAKYQGIKISAADFETITTFRLTTILLIEIFP